MTTLCSVKTGVCSWSLSPETPSDLATALCRLEVSACQLALVPLIDDEATWGHTVETLKSSGISVVSGMLATVGEDYSTLDTIKETGGVARDDRWDRNRDLARRVSETAAANEIELVTFHAGFLPHDSSDPRRAILLDRLREIASIFAATGISIAFETGQESAETLLDALRDLDQPNVGVNFDPANMILYGMGDPVAALRALLPYVKQIHIKDAIPTQTPGTWGTEVCAGTGFVDWSAFFDVIRRMENPVKLIIEREQGASREKDIAAAVALIDAHLSHPSEMNRNGERA